ncbi:hypothetical protein SRHO_G00338270 [Serrasalmus rhombeus]
MLGPFKLMRNTVACVPNASLSEVALRNLMPYSCTGFVFWQRSWRNPWRKVRLRGRSYRKQNPNYREIHSKEAPDVLS